MRITLIFGSSSRRRRRVLLKGYITGCTSESRSTAIFPRAAFSYVHTRHTLRTHVHTLHTQIQTHTHTQPLLIYTLCVKSQTLYEIRQIRAKISSSHFPTVLHVLNPFCAFFPQQNYWCFQPLSLSPACLPLISSHLVVKPPEGE